MPILIRPGDTTDFEAAVALFERSNLARRNGLWPNRLASVARCRESVRRPDSWRLVAEEASVLVGMASAQPMRANEGAGPVVPGGCFLSYLYVVPERWGEGIGGRILDAVLADAERRGYSRIQLWTHEDNEPSVPAPETTTLSAELPLMRPSGSAASRASSGSSRLPSPSHWDLG